MDFPEGATKEEKAFIKKLFIRNLTNSLNSNEQWIKDYEEAIRNYQKHVEDAKKRVGELKRLIKEAEDTGI
jgi:ParB-like chromosome segregation protein Spo0J